MAAAPTALAPALDAVRRGFGPGVRGLIVPAPVDPYDVVPDLYEDLELRQSQALYRDGRFEGFGMDLGVRRFEEGPAEGVAKFVKLFRVVRVPPIMYQRVDEAVALCDLHRDVLAGLRQAGVHPVTVLANDPRHHGLMYLVGVQGLGASRPEAKDLADQGMEVTRKVLRGIYRQMAMRPLETEEARWLMHRLMTWEHVAVFRGLPRPRREAGNSLTMAMAGVTMESALEEQIEVFCRGMSEKEFLMFFLASPLSEAAILRIWKKVSRHLEKVESDVEQTRSFTAGVSLPFGFLGSLGGSQGVTHGDSLGTGTSTTHSLTDSTSTTNGQSEGTSESVSQTTSLSHGVNEGASFSAGQSVGTNESGGQSLSVNHGEQTGTSDSLSFGHSLSDGKGTSTSSSLSDGTSAGQSSSTSNGTNYSESAGQSSSTSEGQGWSQGLSATDGTNSSLGDTYSGSHSSNGSETTGSGTSDNAGIDVVGAGTSGSSGATNGWSASNTDGFNVGSGQSGGLSASSGESGGFSTSDGSSSSQSYGDSSSVSNGDSFGTSASASNGVGTSVSEGAGVSDQASAGISSGASQGVTDGATLTNGVSQGASASSGQSVGTTDSASVGSGQTAGVSDQLSVSQSAGQAAGTANGTSTSAGTNAGDSLGAQWGYSGSAGISPMMSMSIAKKFFSEHVRNLANVLGTQRNRLTLARQEGAWQSHTWMLAPDRTTVESGAAVATTAFWGPSEKGDLPVKFHALVDIPDDERRHLLDHVRTLSACRVREPVEVTPEAYAYSTVHTTSELAVLTHPPRVDLPGLQCLFEPVPPFQLPVHEEGALKLGRLLWGETGEVTEHRFGFDPDRLAHTLICGATRVGKTVSAERLFTSWVNQPPRSVLVRRPDGRVVEEERRFGGLVLDWKRTWRGLLRWVDPNRFCFVSLWDPAMGFRFNPLRVPDGVPVHLHLNRLAETLALAFGLGLRGKGILREVVYSLYDKQQKLSWLRPGAPEGATANVFQERDMSRFCGMVDLYEHVDKLLSEGAKLSSSRRDGLDVAKSRLQYFAPGGDLARIYTRDVVQAELDERPALAERYRQGEFSLEGCTKIEDLVLGDKIVVMEGGPLDAIAKKAVITAMATALFTVAQCRGDNAFSPPLMVVLEEAHQVLVGGEDDVAKISGQDETIWEVMWNESASYGMRMVAIGQMPDRFPPSIMANSGAMIVHNIDTEKAQAAVMTKLSKDYKNDHRPLRRFLGNLPIGWCVVRRPRSRDYADGDIMLVEPDQLVHDTPLDDELRGYVIGAGGRRLVWDGARAA